MSRWKARTELEHQIVLLGRRGRSRRQIARALGVTRALVGKVLDLHVAGAAAVHTALPSSPPPATPRPSKLDAFEPRIVELIKTYPSITAQRVLEELRAAGYTGGYSILKGLRAPTAPAQAARAVAGAPGVRSGADGGAGLVAVPRGVRGRHPDRPGLHAVAVTQPPTLRGLLRQL